MRGLNRITRLKYLLGSILHFHFDLLVHIFLSPILIVFDVASNQLRRFDRFHNSAHDRPPADLGHWPIKTAK